ncbi:MAG TPA: secretion system protein Por [Bacteroidales bacterium]|nr:secretion system protein Por [Bacteroidales bacterium]
MKRYLTCLFSLSLLLSISVRAQTITDSNLPVFIITTDGGAAINDNPRVLASLKIIFRGPGQRNYLTDQNNPLYLNYNGRIDIEIRGSSSQVTNKKNYGFTTRMADNITNNNVSLLNMPEENDWILNGMVFDPAFIRDYLCYNLSRQIGEYASRTEYCELIINGEYKGLYLLQEKIKADDNRVDITKISRNDNQIPDITGGYITKADKTTGGDPVAWNMRSWSGDIVDFIHELPKPENVTPFQDLYIHSQFLDLQVKTANQDVSISGGFPSVIDIPSFIDYILISELGSNADAYQYSTYFHKDRNGKLRAGPIWDNDLTFGNDLFFWGLNRSNANVWQLSDGDNEGARFWRDLILNNKFRCYLAKRWNDLIQPGQPFNQEVISAFIDRTAAVIAEGVTRDNERWLNNGNLQRNIIDIKTWLGNRIPWITSNLGTYDQCENVDLPPLIISKIMYHPAISVEYPDEDKMEYLEITNNGDQTVDLGGIYFAGTGFVFQFPVNSSIEPFSSLILAGNYQIFRSKYGFAPYGQFTRNLSNKTENLVLADAFGNIIDNVCYLDTMPWPDADGNGYYLKLIDPGLDNNNPSNWIASNSILTSVENPDATESLNVYPNPADDMLMINADFEIKSVRVLDIYGRSVLFQRINSGRYELNVKQLLKGIYFLEIGSTAKTYFRKVIVQ